MIKHDDILPEQVIYAKGECNYTRFFLVSGEVLVFSKTLMYFEHKWPGFIRISKTHLINPSYIKRATIGNKMDPGSIIMAGGAALPITRRRRQEVEQRVFVHYNPKTNEPS